MKLILVDDDKLVRLSLQKILESDGFQILGTAEDGSEALALYEKFSPDVVLLDIRMKNVNGIEAAKNILEFDKNAKILLLTTFEDDEYISEALKIGVKGYLLKQDYESITPAINAIMANQSVFTHKVTNKIPNLMKSTKDLTEIKNLSEKEIEVIELVATRIKQQGNSKYFIS